MIDFQASLAKGVASAEEASQNEVEIDEVIANVTDAVERFTSGKITVNYHNTVGALQISLDLISSGMVNDSDYRSLNTIYLVLKNNGAQKVTFARLLRGKRGYPCMLAAGGDSQTCLDKASLLEGFSRILGSHETGNILYRLMNSDLDGNADTSS